MAIDRELLGNAIDLDTFESFYKTSSVDKDAYWKIDSAVGNIQVVPAQDTSVYNGNFITQYLNRTGQAFAGVFTGIPGGITALIGSQIQEKGVLESAVEVGIQPFRVVNPALANLVDLSGLDERVERFIGERIVGSYDAYLEKSELIGEKLVNYGLYMADVGKEFVADMERQHPTTNPAAKFLGDATGSILATVGLFAIGGPALPITVFGASSGLDVGVEALEAGKSSDVALAATILTGGTVSALESIGLKSIFRSTVRSGVKAAAAHIVTALATEGITEGLQTAIELGGGLAVGGQKELTLLSAVSQIAYAGAVGAFSGGVMVGGVTLKQRHSAVNMIQKTLGIDRSTSARVYKEAEQAAMETVFAQAGKDTGYDTIQNRKYQNMRDIFSLARGEAGVDNEAATRILESLSVKNPSEQLLAEIRAQATADINAEIDEGTITGVSVPGGRGVKKAAETLENLETTQIQEQEDFVPIDQETINNVEPIHRQVFIGRFRELTQNARETKKNLKSLLRAKKGEINTKAVQKAMDKYIDATSELTYLKENPTDIVFTGDNKIVLVNAEVLMRIADKQTALILRNVSRNFTLGKRASRAELIYVKAVLKRLLRRPGITQAQKFEQFGRWINQIQTPEQLQKRFAELEMKVDDILKQNLMATFKESINNMQRIMKGKGVGLKRKVKLSAKAQNLADIFLKALKQPDIDPSETIKTIDTPQGMMRTLAARLATETNPNGTPLTPRDYMNIESALRSFIAKGSLLGEQDRQIQKRTIERQREQVIEDLQRTKGLAKTSAQKTWEKIMDSISRHLNYDALVGSLAKGSGTEIGSSVLEATMDFNRSYIKKETLESFFTTQFIDGAKSIFDISSTLDLNKKFLRDNVNENEVIVSKEKSEGVLENFWNGTIAQAREKYMLWLSPDGQQIMKKRGWNDDVIVSLIDSMSEQDIQFIVLQLEIYNDMYIPVNETFRKMNGYDLGYRERYSPVYREDIEFETSNMIDQLIGRVPVSPDNQNVSFLKELSKSKKSLKDVADFKKMSYYIRDASYYAAMAEKVNQVQEVINDSAVRKQIEDVRDKDFYNRLNKYIKLLAQGKRYGSGDLNSLRNKWVTNMQKMLLAGKAILFPKQLVSAFAAMEIVNPGDFVSSIAKLPTALKNGDLSEFLEHPYFAHRSMRRAISRDIFDMNASFEAGQIGMKQLKKAEFGLTLNNYLFLATQLGDMGGVILNGWAVYNHFLNEGLSKSEAANRAVIHIDRTQQSARVTQQIGISLDPNPIVRAFTSFTHAPMQYASILVQQLDTIGTARFNVKQFARTYAIFFTILPMLYAAIGRAFNYKKEDAPQYIAEFALGPFDDIPLVGGLLRVLVSRATYNIYKRTVDEEVKLPFGGRWGSAGTGLFGSMLKNIADVERALAKEYEDGIRLSDFFHIVTQVAEATGPLGGLYSGIGRAVSNAAEGIVLMSEENAEGTTVNSVRRLLMTLGYSEFATRPEEE